MFSGIVEATARLVATEREGGNITFTFASPLAGELHVDQSLAHNGVCLTVTSHTAATYTVTAMAETLRLSNLGLLALGDEVNLERSMTLSDRLDGHLVQGHVDTTARCTRVTDADGSHEYEFLYHPDPDLARRGYLTVDKGSVTVNGVSLTVCRPTDESFTVCIIPYTFENTNFHALRPGSTVNVEFDIVGKYLARLMSLR